MQVLHYPNPILRTGGQPVTTFGSELESLAKDMLATMYESKGVGLAAPQVGLAMNLLVLNPTGEATTREHELVVVNPQILERKRLEYGQEGCLSFPGIYADVERHKAIVVRYQDLAGKTVELKDDDFVARIVQHEMDHLLGVLFVDRLSPTDRIRVRQSLERLEERWRAGA
jgi:peptide deformylase